MITMKLGCSMQRFGPAFGLIATLASPAVCRVLRDISLANKTYDYVIAGGGLSGLVVANRLTENSSVSVLVVEYGDFDDSWELAIPYHAMTLHGELLFTVNSVRQPGLSNRTFGLPLGATVGGGSTVNGMSVSRGSRHDYDDWERLGNPGWGWEGLVPYFRKSSTYTAPTAASRERFGCVASGKTFGEGPFQVGFPTWAWSETYNYVRAWTEDLGFPLRDDGAFDGETVGVSWKPINIDPKNVTRSSARKAYYDPAGLRPNLDILVNHYVIKAEITDGVSVGVYVTAANSASSANGTLITNRLETILAAGAIHTPQILQGSGVGPRHLLEELKIPVVMDLPGVGANFQDHFTNRGMVWEFRNDTVLNPSLLEDPTFKAAARDEYMANRTGPWSSSHGLNRIILSLRNLTTSSSSSRSSPSSHYDRITAQIASQSAALLLANTTPDYLPPIYRLYPTLLAGYTAQHSLLSTLYASEQGVFEYTWGGTARPGIVGEKPFSRGTVSIRSSTAHHPARNAPSLDFGSMTNPVDMSLAIAGARLARRLMRTPSMAVLRPIEIVPGENAVGDEDENEEDDAVWERLLRGNLLSPHNAHPCGTAAMMPRELGGVVDARLRVYGVRGLRVVDASVFPVIPTAHLQSTMYAVAEKAGDLIKGL